MFFLRGLCQTDCPERKKQNKLVMKKRRLETVSAFSCKICIVRAGGKNVAFQICFWYNKDSWILQKEGGFLVEVLLLIDQRKIRIVEDSEKKYARLICQV